MFETIFQDGINFEVETDSYRDIFEPVKALCQSKAFLTSLS